MKNNVFLARYFLLSFIILLVFSCDKDDDSNQKHPYKNSVDFLEGRIFYGGIITSSKETMDYLQTFKVTKVEDSTVIIDTLNITALSTIKEVTNNIRLNNKQYVPYKGAIDGLLNLKCLSEIRTIGGNLEIFDTQLDNLQGLNNLQVIGEDTLNVEIKDSQIIIRDNKALSVLDGLVNIITTSHLTIRNNVNLYNFCALKDIEVLGLYNLEGNWLNPTVIELNSNSTYQKEIYRNPNCEEAYKKKLYSEDIITIESEQELIEFGNEQYTDIEGTITISGVNSLPPIQRLILIDELVIKNTELLNLDDFKYLTVVNSLQLIDNPLLEHLKGLSNAMISQPNVISYEFDFLKESGSLVVSNNDALVNLEGLEKIEYLKTVLIENNKALISLKALSNLAAISNLGRNCEYVNGDFLKTINNDALLNLEGLENMSVLHLYIYNNDALLDLKGLSKISRLELLSVKDNKNITSLNGLNSINEIVNYYDCWAHPRTTILTNNLSLNNFCILKDVNFDYPSPDNYQVVGNAYNPTLAQIKTDDVKNLYKND